MKKIEKMILENKLIKVFEKNIRCKLSRKYKIKEGFIIERYILNILDDNFYLSYRLDDDNFLVIMIDEDIERIIYLILDEDLDEIEYYVIEERDLEKYL